MTAVRPEPEPIAETVTPTSLHLSFAKYGRVGKSTWLKLLIEYMLEKKKQHIIVDTDKETPNVARAYTPEILDVWAGNKVTNESLDNLLFDDLAVSATISIGDNSIDEFVRDAIETWTIKAFDEIEQTTWL
jgi:hypothetical protein